jgi:uncharacterized radical SAM superfamily Fe-S cluster-containing enzyme
MIRSIKTPEGLFTYDRGSGYAAYVPSIRSRSWEKPLYAQIAVTEKCNQSCPFCYADASPNKSRMWKT